MKKPPQKKPGVTIRIGANGQMSRRKRRMTVEEVAAKMAALPAEVQALRTRDRAPPAAVDAALARMERSEARQDTETGRMKSYLGGISARRAAVAGRSGKAAEREQAEAYYALGVDQRAGFEGRPPAFTIVGRDRTDSGEVLIRAKNVARDPVRILWNQGALTKRQYVAAVALADLLEQYASVGVRAVAFSEFVDGGKAPDVSTHALAVARKMAAWERAFSEQERGLLRAVTIEGQTISDLARSGRYGANRKRVKEKLTAALEGLADWFEVR